MPALEPRVKKLENLRNAILSFYHTEKRYPSFKEMKSILNVRSKGSVFIYVKKMIDAGYLLQMNKGDSIQLPRQYLRIPYLGTVGALFSPAEDELVDLVSLNDWLIKDVYNTFLLAVCGDAMLGEGIKDGDVVLVERKKEIKEGDIVVVSIEGQWMMRYLRKKGDTVVLEAANDKYPPITPGKEVEIDLVVKSVIRRYK